MGLASKARGAYSARCDRRPRATAESARLRSPACRNASVLTAVSGFRINGESLWLLNTETLVRVGQRFACGVQHRVHCSQCRVGRDRIFGGDVEEQAFRNLIESIAVGAPHAPTELRARLEVGRLAGFRQRIERPRPSAT